MLVERDEIPMLLAARIDDGDRRPPAVPLHLRVPVLEPSWAQAHLYRALSVSGSGDNNPDSFSRSFVGALLPARPHDPGSHGGWIRSAFPRRARCHGLAGAERTSS